MKTDNSQRDKSFIKEIEKISGKRVADCYQCGKCSAGCPIGYTMDALPDKVIRYIQLGLKEDVMACSSPWMCASCETCSTRCPQDVEPARIMEAVRVIATRENIPAARRNVSVFYKAFMDSVNANGRIFEPMMAAKFNMSTLQPMKDMGNAVTLMKKGKIAFKPSKSRDIPGVKRMFQRTKTEES